MTPDPTAYHTPAPLDLSPQGIRDLHSEIDRAIRRGLIQPNFAQAARMAVADGIRAGLVQPPHNPATTAAANLKQPSPRPPLGGGSKVWRQSNLDRS